MYWIFFGGFAGSNFCIGGDFYLIDLKTGRVLKCMWLDDWSSYITVRMFPTNQNILYVFSTKYTEISTYMKNVSTQNREDNLIPCCESHRGWVTLDLSLTKLSLTKLSLTESSLASRKTRITYATLVSLV